MRRQAHWHVALESLGLSFSLLQKRAPWDGHETHKEEASHTDSPNWCVFCKKCKCKEGGIYLHQ